MGTKTKTKFEGWRRECISASVEYNLPKRVVIYISGPIPSKKNQKRAFRGIVLPSVNFVEWHKRMVNYLGNTEWKFDSYPCKITITSIVGDRVKSDCDNQLSSIQDLLVDLGVIEDDNRFLVKEVNVKNIGYVKNLWLHRIEIEPYEGIDYDLLDEHKGKNLMEFKHLLDGLQY